MSFVKAWLDPVSVPLTFV